MKRFLCSVLLIICVLCGIVPPIYATEGQGTQTYTTSEQGIAFINEMMGGSYAGTQRLAAAEATVNKFIVNNNLALWQEQFDALTDLVMAYGDYILTSGYRIETLIASGSYTDVDVANAFCAWVKEGEAFSQPRLNRRLREAKLFLYGSYDGQYRDTSFRYVIFYPNGGQLDENTVLCYSLNEAYGTLPLASREGKHFAGWYTASSDGSHLCNGDIVTENRTVYAHWSDTPVENPNEPGDNEGSYDDGGHEDLGLRTSEDCIQFIKLNEGFTKYPMWDYAQYSVGYGTRCEAWEFPNGITEEEADLRLRQMLKSFEGTLEKLEQKRGAQFTQQQFDALMSLTMNLGNQWLKEDKKIYQYVMEGSGYTELEFVNAIGSWSSAGGNVLAGLMRRRMDEANMYLNGSYEKGSLRYFGISFNALQGEAETRVRYYMTGEPLGTLVGASRSGYHLEGWYDKASGGTRYTGETVAPSYGTITLYAHWAQGELPAEPTEGTEATEPTGTTEPTSETPTEPTTQAPTEPPVIPDVSFKDVKRSAWYYDYVARAVYEGLFGGVSEKEFAPESTMTRAMLVTVLHRLAGKPDVTDPTPFTDVQAGTWYDAGVRWAYQTKIVNGMSASKFGVTSNVTREQLTTMLFRYAQHYGIDTTGRADTSGFKDHAKVSAYARDAIAWAVAEGIVSGDGTNLMPQGNATRAQCAKMMVVFLDKIRAEQPEPTEPTTASEEPTTTTDESTAETDTLGNTTEDSQMSEETSE